MRTANLVTSCVSTCIGQMSLHNNKNPYVNYKYRGGSRTLIYMITSI